ncbi:MAG TPA: type IV secretion system protein, partial [Streptosporangiaceae bacterium]|nr:type IV secretion system protein [Streptosporangiaceae bacterium]
MPGIGDIGGLLGLCSLGTSGLTGDLNSICSPSLPNPEPADSGIDAMVAPPASGKQPDTLYSELGVSGDFWAATDLQCSDSTSLIGNEVAGVVFDAAKSLDRVTITIYQSAAGNGILSWLSNVSDKLITGLGNAIYFPYLAVIVIIGAIWLAWQGLIRKRGTRTIEGTVWMVVAASAAIFLIGKPADLTGLGQGVTNGISQTLNVAFAKLPSPGPSDCVPVQKGDPQARPTNFAYTSGNSVVDQNADELWTVLVCKPWLDGELGTDVFNQSGKGTVVNTYGRQLLWAQSIASNEKASTDLIQAKQATYSGIAQSIKNKQPAVYPLFQGKQWTTRLEIAFAALFAALVAGLLILLISVTLILLKLGFLLLLIVGPFFLLIGTHPGFGRVIALRWVEMLVGVLLKQAAVALTLSVLLYCYALIMGTSDAVLPWALKILMIALVTVAAFIYRKPFTHLFSAVGYGVIGSRDRADEDLARAGGSFRDRTRTAATLTVPGVAAFRAARYARRNPGEAAGLALSAASALGVAGGAKAAAGAAGVAGAPGEGGAVRPVVSEEAGAAAAAASGEVTSGRAAAAGRGRARAARDEDGSTRKAPPLNLPSRSAGSA